MGEFEGRDHWRKRGARETWRPAASLKQNSGGRHWCRLWMGRSGLEAKQTRARGKSGGGASEGATSGMRRHAHRHTCASMHTGTHVDAYMP